MKKWMKGILIAGGVLTVAGVGMITAAAVNGGENFLSGIPRHGAMNGYCWTHGRQEYVPVPEIPETALAELPQAETAAENAGKAAQTAPDQQPVIQEGERFRGVTELEWENCGADARITETDHLNEGEIQVNQMGDGYEYEVWQEGTELKISVPRPMRKGFLSHILDSEAAMKEVEILVPAGFCFQELSIESVSGNVFAEVLRSGELSLEAVSGSIAVGEVQAGELSLEAVSGSIEISGGSVRSIEAENVSGSISCMAAADTEASVENISGDTALYMAGDIGNYDYEVERAGGQILLTGSTAVDYSSQIGNTRIDNRTGRKIDLECVGGSILLQYEAAMEHAL